MEKTHKQTSEFKSLKQLTAGTHACHDALRDGREFERVFIRKGARGELFEEIIGLCKEKAIPFSFVPGEKLDRLTNVNHQGIVALHAEIAYQKYEDIIPFLFEQGESPLCIILDRITDVRNFGAIVRTAESLGAHCIIIPDRGAAQINTEAIKTSAGAISRLPICRTDSLKEAISFLKMSGLRIVAASEKGSSAIYEAEMSGPLGVIMGSEEDGVSSELLEQTDDTLRIPMTGATGSLNVSVALGMFVYEAIRQRNSK
jgi:23S rRNA (guanosine2251-2'-O)-methyltransferase